MIDNELLTAEELNVVIANGTTNMAILTDPQQKIIWVNKAFTDVTGYTLQDCKGRKPSFLQNHLKNQPSLKRIREALKVPEPVKELIENFTKDGKKYWALVEITPLYDENGELKSFLSLQTDLTQQMKLRAESEEIKNQLRAVFDHTTVSHVMFSAKYEVLQFNNMANQLMYEICQCPLIKGQRIQWPTELMEKTFSKYFDKAWLSQEAVMIEKEVDLGTKMQWLRMEYHPILNDKGSIQSLSFQVIDIDTIKRAEQQEREQKQLLYGIADIYSHQIRGPVASIQGLMQLLDGTELGEHNNEVYQKLVISVEKLEKAINNTVHMAHLAS